MFAGDSPGMTIDTRSRIMRSRDLQALALAGVTAFAVACGGDAAEDGAAMDAAPAEETGGAAMQDVELPEGVTMEMVTQGRELFSGRGGCHACHNAQATGTQLAPDLTDDEWVNVSGRDYEEIVNLIRTGVPQPQQHPAPMPPMGGANLSAEQVNALAAYIVALGG
jgi:cytochrome c5